MTFSCGGEILQFQLILNVILQYIKESVLDLQTLMKSVESLILIKLWRYCISFGRHCFYTF